MPCCCPESSHCPLGCPLSPRSSSPMPILTRDRCSHGHANPSPIPRATPFPSPCLTASRPLFLLCGSLPARCPSRGPRCPPGFPSSLRVASAPTQRSVLCCRLPAAPSTLPLRGWPVPAGPCGRSAPPASRPPALRGSRENEGSRSGHLGRAWDSAFLTQRHGQVMPRPHPRTAP